MIDRKRKRKKLSEKQIFNVETNLVVTKMYSPAVYKSSLISGSRLMQEIYLDLLLLLV